MASKTLVKLWEFIEAPIPPSDSFWWKRTSDEPQWSDMQLHNIANELSATIRHKNGPWLSESALADLEKSPKLKIVFEDETGKQKNFVHVNKKLIQAFSRDVKDTILYNLEHNNCETTTISDWFYYLVMVWDRPFTEGSRSSGKGRSSTGPEIYSQRAELWKASKVFFHWILTGKIVVELDQIITKDFLLCLARALGSPFFRRAILQQL